MGFPVGVRESEKWCWKNIVAGRKRHTGAERTHEAQGSLYKDPGVGRSGVGFGRAWDGWVPVAAAIPERDEGARGGGSVGRVEAGLEAPGCGAVPSVSLSLLAC